MDVGLNSLYNIGLSYSVKLNDKETLVYEEDETGHSKKSQAQKLQEKEQTQKEKKSSSDEEKLSEDEKQLVKDLQARDAEVKTHESAHQAAGGGMTGAASFSYQQGPDGKMYAIGGEVSISTPSGSTPQETIANAQQVIAAAMAPADPSGQDFSVASSARVMMVKAQQQKTKEMQEKQDGQQIYQNSALSDKQNAQEESKKIDIPA